MGNRRNALVVSIACLMCGGHAHALKLSEFASMCETLGSSSAGSCSSHPVIQAYVGGALDLIATLDENTDYLSKIYCRDASELFDVAKIVDYMLQAPDDEGDSNAMLRVVRFLEDEGKCP